LGRSWGELGYIEGQTIALLDRDSQGRGERLAELAADLAGAGVSIIVSYGTPATRAAMHATTTIPIVMIGVGDPVGAGIVTGLGRPAGNVTGNTNIASELTAKRMELLREVLPGLSRVAYLWNPTNASSRTAFQGAANGARALGVMLHS